MKAIVASLTVSLAFAAPGSTRGQVESEAPARSDFPLGTATPSEVCGACHQAIYHEYAYGFGADLSYAGMVYGSPQEKRLAMPAGVPSRTTAHSAAGVDPFPVHARDVEEGGRSCNVCHFPQPFEIPSLESPEIGKSAPRPKEQEASGLTCASCHLTPEGSIRGPYKVNAPHATVAEPAMQTAASCAYCHSLGSRVVGKQTQTFLEWREDFFKPGLGRQHCQDCHMPRTLRPTTGFADAPVRAVARHLWTGGHSAQRLGAALSLVPVQPENDRARLEFHVINIGAGHSVPTGSNRRAVFLDAHVLDSAGRKVAAQQWMFAPWYGSRPDDRAFLEEDKKRPDALSATQADAQGPHEPPIRAGEERVLAWEPRLGPGRYTVEANLLYDLNRYNDRSFKEDQQSLVREAIPLVVKPSQR